MCWPRLARILYRILCADIARENPELFDSELARAAVEATLERYPQ